jgi:hypothetical protein
MLLRQPADECIGRGEADLSIERLDIAGQDPQQRALTGTVGTDDTDDIAGRNREIQSLEEGAVSESASHILGH